MPKFSFRFASKRNFAHDIHLPPPLSNDEARALHQLWRETGSSDTFGRLWAGLCWLAEDLAQRAVSYYDLPSHAGEELISAGCASLKARIRQLPDDVENIKAWLAYRLAGDILTHMDRLPLCSVPASTNRSRAQKGLDLHKAPAIHHVAARHHSDADLKDGDDAGYTPHPFDWQTVQDYRRRERHVFRGWTQDDIYALCESHIDREIVRLRYHDGDGPRCGKEVAFILDMPYRQVMDRLDEIESRVYNAANCRKPRRSRQPGKKFSKKSRARTKNRRS